jgi:hypothetical protein
VQRADRNSVHSHITASVEARKPEPAMTWRGGSATSGDSVIPARRRRMQARKTITHCDSAVALLEGAACVFIQLWIFVMPRAVRGAHVAREGALSHGCTEEKDVPLARGYAPQPSGAETRGIRRMRQLRRTEAAAPCMQPLRAIRWARSCRSREAAEGRRPGLRPVPGARLVRL